MPPSPRIAVDAVIGLDLVGFLVTRLALLVVALAVRHRLGRKRFHCAGRRAGAEHMKELTTPQGRLALRLHSRTLRSFAPAYSGSANPSVSISMNRSPTAPTWR